MNVDQAPSRQDPWVRAMSPAIGGPLGEHSGGHRWFTPMRVLLLLTALTFAIGLAAKTPCYDSSFRDNADTYGRMCYSDIPGLYHSKNISDWPYGSGPVDAATLDAPVGVGYWAFGTGWLTEQVIQLFPDDHNLTTDAYAQQRLFYLITVLGFAVVALACAWLLVRAAGRRPWDVAGFAVAPVLAAAAFISWDVLAMAATAAALLAWHQRRWLMLGVTIGLGLSLALYPVALLVAVLALCLRGRRLDVATVVGATAVGTWLVLNAPAMLTGWDNWSYHWVSLWQRGAELGSLWTALEHLGGQTWAATSLTQWALILFVGWCIVVVLLTLATPQAPRLAQVAFLLVAGFMILNKVYSPQFVLALLPLAVLARPRMRDQIVWQSGEILYFVAVWWFLGGWLKAAGSEGAPAYDLAIWLRVAAEVYLMVMVLRDMFAPELDEVRTANPDPLLDPLEDDPADEAPEPVERAAPEAASTR